MLRLEADLGPAPYSAERTGSPELHLIPQHEPKKGRVSFCISRLFSLALNRGAR